MAVFVVQPSVQENVAELLRFLGSATRPLSLADFAALLNSRDGRQRGASTIQRWRDGAEPDLGSIEIMASLAGVSFEEFALGKKRRTAVQSEGGIPHAADVARRQQKGKREA